MHRFLFIILILFIFCPTSFAYQNLITTMEQAKKSTVLVQALVIDAKQNKNKSLALTPDGRIVNRSSTNLKTHQRIGSGVILDTNGIIVTNTHTVVYAQHILVKLHDGQSVPAHVLGIVPELDLTYLKLAKPVNNLMPITMVNSDQVPVRSEIIHIGSSALLRGTISSGKVIALAHNRNPEHKTDMFQINLNLYHGDSGGPVLNRYGDLIGMIVAKQTTQDRSSFAIPSNKIYKYYLQYKNK